MDEEQIFFLSFLIPLIVRAVPEIIGYQWPLGYDTITFYAPFIRDYQVYGLFASLSLFSNNWAPLLYLLVGFVGGLSQADPLLVLSFFAPVLTGFLSLSIFYFLTDYLGWSDRRGLVCAVLCVSYFVVLRITWDLFRNALGLVFFFLAISQTRSLEGRRRFFLFVLFSLLCLFSNELVSILLFIVIGYLLLLELFPSFRTSGFLTGAKSYLVLKLKFLRRSGEETDSEFAESKNKKRGKIKMLKSSTGDVEHTWYQRFFGTDFRPRVVAVYIFILAFTIIIMFYYAGYLQFGFSSDLFSTGNKGLLTDYVTGWFGFLSYPSVDTLRFHIISFFLLCFLPIIPFVVLGYFRNRLLDVLTLFLLVGSFMPVVFPHSALPFWYRWMIMLTFPFIIYAFNFLLPDKQNSVLIRRLKISKKTRRAALFAVLPVLIFLSSTYMVTTTEDSFPYFSVFDTQMYLPSGMQSSSVPFSQCPYVVLAGEWLKWNMPPDSCLITQESLYGWATLNLPFRPIYIYASMDEGLASALLWSEFYNSTYVLTTPPFDFFIRRGNFELIFQMGSIEVFRSVD